MLKGKSCCKVVLNAIIAIVFGTIEFEKKIHFQIKRMGGTLSTRRPYQKGCGIPLQKLPNVWRTF